MPGPIAASPSPTSLWTAFCLGGFFFPFLSRQAPISCSLRKGMGGAGLIKAMLQGWHSSSHTPRCRRRSCSSSSSLGSCPASPSSGVGSRAAPQPCQSLGVPARGAAGTDPVGGSFGGHSSSPQSVSCVCRGCAPSCPKGLAPGEGAAPSPKGCMGAEGAVPGHPCPAGGLTRAGVSVCQGRGAQPCWAWQSRTGCSGKSS